MKQSIDPHGDGKRRVLVALLFIASLAQPPGVRSQDAGAATPTPAVTADSGEVNKSGYSLKPKGLSTGEWPNLRLDFSIERSDHTPFRNLNLADVQPRLDGQILATREGDLRLRDNEGSTVLLLLDGSGSMSGMGVDKLRAAKEALKTLVNNLGPSDRVEVVTFDEETSIIVPPTSDKELLKREIENFSIRRDKSRFTMLYDAVDFALLEARQKNIKHVLVISDGWEDTPQTRAFAPAQLDEYKQRREQGIIDSSRSNDVRVFTVAIGDEHGKGLNYVDRAALAHISQGANGGIPAYIELTSDSENKALQEKELLAQLQQTLDALRQSFRYSYSLTLHLDQSMQRDGREHKLWVGFSVGETPRIQLPVEYTLAWATSGPPVVKAVNVQPAIFIQSAPRSIKWPQLLLIYLALLLLLIVLALLPAVGRRLVGGGKAVRLLKAIVTVGDRSPLIGSPCPNEGAASGRRYLIKAGDVVLVCPQCKTRHHLSCWRFNEHHCMNRTCEFEMVIPSQILEKYGLMERELP
jgi:Mg-chelatase subunit ChlD